jgi:hypothetical protein
MIVKSPARLFGIQLIKIIILILIAQTAFASSELAAEDYQSYKESRYSAGKWDELVKKGIESFHGGDY